MVRTTRMAMRRKCDRWWRRCRARMNWSLWMVWTIFLLGRLKSWEKRSEAGCNRRCATHDNRRVFIFVATSFDAQRLIDEQPAHARGGYSDADKIPALLDDT